MGATVVGVFVQGRNDVLADTFGSGRFVIVFVILPLVRFHECR